MLRHRTPRALIATAAALALPAVALAAHPTADGTYSQTKGNRGVINLHVSKSGKTIDNIAAYSKCNPVPLQPPYAIKVNKAGAFSLKGERKDVLGHSIKVVLSGKFVKPGEVKGSYRMSVDKGAKRCNSKTVKFDAKLAQAGS